MLTEINNNLEAIKEFAKKQKVDPLDDDWVAYNDRIDLNFWNGKVIAYPVDENGNIITLNEFVVILE
jgi:hypothetical protein